MRNLQGHYYHVYNRGCNRQPIFLEEENYIYLLTRIKAILPEEPVTIVAYCLMPNHYHFLLRAEADTAIGHFTQRLFNGYTQAINQRYQRSGTLFQGRAKSIDVQNEPYALHLCRYIHLNPVVAGLVSRPEQWVYSNYLEWTGKRNGTLIDTDFVSLYAPSQREYESFIVSSIDEALEAKLARYYLD
jgi:REP element-mobilizing transposase RayT